MYSLSIFFGPSPVPAQFLFKDKDKAYSALEKSMGPTQFCIIDDFGQVGHFKTDIAHTSILEDMDLGEESRIQRGLSQARGQAKANERAKTDPTLRAMMNGQGPAILSPGGFGRN